MTIKMKTKFFSFAILSVLALMILASGMVSATTSSAFTITNVNHPTSVDGTGNSLTFTFNLTYTGSSSNIDLSFADSTSSIGTVSIPTATGMDGTVHESRIITGTVSGFSGHFGETIKVTVNATTGSSTDDQTVFFVTISGPTELSSCS